MFAAGARRRPLMSTSVRTAPSPRKSTVAVPDAPFDISDDCPANTCGKLFSSCSKDVVPCNFGSWDVIVDTGDTEVRPFCGMRDPVTVTFSTGAAVESCAKAGEKPAAVAIAALAISVDLKVLSLEIFDTVDAPCAGAR